MHRSNSTNILSSSLLAAIEMTESASFLRGEGRSRKAATGNLKLLSSVERSDLPQSPPTTVLTTKIAKWYEITFDDEDGGWLDDDERRLFEDAQYGPPIVLDHNSSRSYVEQVNHHVHK